MLMFKIITIPFDRQKKGFEIPGSVGGAIYTKDRGHISERINLYMEKMHMPFRRAHNGRFLMERGTMKRIAMLIGLSLLLAVPAAAERGRLQVGIFPKPPSLELTMKLAEPSGNNILDGGESGSLILTVRNSGLGEAMDVKGEIVAREAAGQLEFPRLIAFGNIAPGASVTKEVAVRAGEDVRGGDAAFQATVREANGFDADPLRVAFQVRPFEPPRLVVADMGIEDASGNSRVEPMENVEVTARVQNVGHGAARKVTVDVVTGTNVYMGGERITHFDLGNLDPGQHRDVKVLFYTNKRIGNGEKIPISLDIREARGRFNVSQPLQLAMNAPQRAVQELVVKGNERRRDEIQLATGLSVDVDVNVPAGKGAGPDDVAVVIGNRHYSARGVPEVSYADRDARMMKEYLVRTFNFAPENIIYEEDAPLSKFNEIFGTEKSRGKLFNYVKRDVSKIFIYYVGHGAPDLESGEAYFVPVDGNPQYIAANGYRLQLFYDNLGKVPARRVTVVLDACFSGNSAGGLLFKNISPTLLKVKKDYQGPRNATIMTSAGVDQVSSWYPDKRHSLFTYYFLKGIQGEADKTGDGRITVGEIRDYLGDRVPHWARRISAVEQTPVVRGGENEILVTIRK